MIACNHCGAKNQDNAKVCIVCGKPIESKVKYTGVDNTPVPWYATTWFVILMLIIFFPVGLILMWTKKKFNLIVRIIITIFFAIIIIGSIGSSDNNSTTNSTDTVIETTVIETVPETTIKETVIETTEAQKQTKKVDIYDIITFFNDNLLSDIKLYNSSIVDCGVKMNTADNYIMINIVVQDSTNDETAMDIADTVVRQLNLAANMCDSLRFRIGSNDNYGGLYDEYNAMVGVAPLSKTGDSKAWYIYDAITGGRDMLKLQKKK